jgi:hypothetical protein
MTRIERMGADIFLLDPHESVQSARSAVYSLLPFACIFG